MKVTFMESARTASIVIALTLLSNQSLANNDLVYSQAGDVTDNSAVMWGRCNQEKKAMLVFSLATKKEALEKAHDKHSHDKHTHVIRKRQIVTDNSDYTGSIVIDGLKSGTKYFYQAECKSTSHDKQSPDAGKISRVC